MQNFSADTVYQKIFDLRKKIEHHNFRYYGLDHPQITDAEFDALIQQLKNLEEKYPQFASESSPTRRVGGVRQSATFAAHLHSLPMLSLDNVYNAQELTDWWTRAQKGLNGENFSVTVEPKIDGLSLSLIYEKGILKTAATRGDGNEGEEVTANVKTIRSVPLSLNDVENVPEYLECRGEVFILKEDFKKLNHELFLTEEKQFANPRNAAAGSLRQKDSAETAKRPLRFYVHSAGILPKEISIQSHLEFIQLCHQYELPSTIKFLQVAQSVEEIVKIYEKYIETRSELPYEIDGIVIKINSFEQQKTLGFTNKSPRWAVAFKFVAHQAETLVREIVFSVGRTGTITPVAKVEAVECGGVKISSVSLHNFDEIARLNIHCGDRVLIERAGDVIPKVVRVLESFNGLEIVPPKFCPSCHGEILKDEEEVAYRCLNPFCPGQLERKLLHFASRHGLDIQGLGESVIAELVQKKFVQNAADLFFLTKDQLLQCAFFADKKADNLLQSIQDSKSCTLAQLLNALGMRHVGEKLAQTLAEKFENLDSLMQATVEQLEQIPEIGPNVASSAHQFFSDRQTVALVEQLKKAKVGMIQPPRKLIEGAPLSGKIFVFTGELRAFSRQEAESKIVLLGGKAVSAVSKKTSYVIIGDSPGSKLKKAQTLNIPILTEEEFKKLLEINQV